MKKSLTQMLVLSSVCLLAPACAETVVVAAKSSTVTIAQACAAFLGKAGTLVPINLTEASVQRDEFHKHLCDKDPQQVKAIWAKLLFTGKVSSKPKEVSSADEMKKALLADPNAVGYLDRAAADASLKIISN